MSNSDNLRNLHDRRLLLLAGLVVVVGGVVAGQLWQPAQNRDWQLQVTPPGKILSTGSSVEIFAVAEPREALPELPDSAWLHRTMGRGGRARPPQIQDRMEMPRNSEGVYAVRIPNIYSGFDYVVVLGNRRSRRHRIDVIAPPEIQTLKLRVLPPAESEQAGVVREDLAGEIPVPANSRLHLRLSLNRPVAAATWVWLSEPPPGNLQPARKTETVPLPLTDEGRKIDYEWSIERGGAFMITVRDEFGLESILDSEGQIVLQREAAGAGSPGP